MVLPPMRESFLKSDNEATPQISEVITSGMAMSLRRFRKIVPNGATQSVVNCPQPYWAAATPKSAPSAMPRRICQCSCLYHAMRTAV